MFRMRLCSAVGSGEITFDDMDCFLRSINIKVSKTTLHNFFELWAGELSREDLDRGQTTMRCASLVMVINLILSLPRS